MCELKCQQQYFIIENPVPMSSLVICQSVSHSLFHDSASGNHLSTAMAGTDFGFSPRSGVMDISMDGSFIGRTDFFEQACE